VELEAAHDCQSSIHPHQTHSTSTHVPIMGSKKSFSKHPKKSERDSRGCRRSKPKSNSQETKPQMHKCNSASLLRLLWKVLEQFPWQTLSWWGHWRNRIKLQCQQTWLWNNYLSVHTCRYSIHLVMKKDNYLA